MARRSRSGELRDRVIIQQRDDDEAVTAAGDCAKDTQYTEVARVNARVKPIGGQQLIESRESTFQQTYSVEIRYFPTMTKNYELLYRPPRQENSLRLAIEDIRERDETDGLGRRMLLRCRIISEDGVFENPSPSAAFPEIP